jgi:hypothetical protein
MSFFRIPLPPSGGAARAKKGRTDIRSYLMYRYNSKYYILTIMQGRALCRREPL